MAQADSNANKLSAIKRKSFFGSKDIVKVKAKIDIVVLAVQSLGSKLEGHEVWVKWKRGSRSSNSGETKKHVVRKGEAFLEEPISFTTTLTQGWSRDLSYTNAPDAKTEKFETKKVEFKVKEQKEKKDHSVGKAVTVDLATIAKKGTHETRSLQLEKGKKDSPILMVSFTTDWVKINGKRLTKCEFVFFFQVTSRVSGSQIGGLTAQKAETVRIEGEEYMLSPEDAPSAVDTTAGDLSEEEPDEAPHSTPASLAVAGTTPAVTSPTAAAPVLARSGASDTAEATDLASLTAELARVKEKYAKEKERYALGNFEATYILRRKAEKAEVERLQKALDTTKRTSLQTKEVELLRTQLSNLANGDAAQQAVQLQMEIERLKDEQANTLRQGKRASRAASALSEEQVAMLKEVEILRTQVAEYKARAPPASLKADESAVRSRDLASAQAEIAELKKEKEGLRDKLADQKKLVDAAIAERDAQKKESADARTKHRMLQSQVDELRDKLSSVNASAQDERQVKLEMEKLKAENKVLRVDREQYRDKLAEVERTARVLPAAGSGKAAAENNQFWMYAFLVLFVVNIVLIRYF